MSWNVLLIEADAAVAEEIRAAFAPAGFLVVVNEAGESALERARAAPPNLILLSAELPDMSGFSVCNRLKRALPATPLILYTREATDGAIEAHRASKGKADAYLRAPLDMADLLGHAAQLLHAEPRRPPRASDRPAAAARPPPAAAPPPRPTVALPARTAPGPRPRARRPAPTPTVAVPAQPAPPTRLKTAGPRADELLAHALRFPPADRHRRQGGRYRAPAGAPWRRLWCATGWWRAPAATPRLVAQLVHPASGRTLDVRSKPSRGCSSIRAISSMAAAPANQASATGRATASRWSRRCSPTRPTVRNSARITGPNPAYRHRIVFSYGTYAVAASTPAQAAR